MAHLFLIALSTAIALGADSVDLEETSVLQLVNRKTRVVSQEGKGRTPNPASRLAAAILAADRTGDDVCMDVLAGERAPFVGTFTTTGGSEFPVVPGDVALSAGTYCVQRTTLALLQRSSAVNIGADGGSSIGAVVEASMNQKDSSSNSSNSSNVEGSVSGKGAAPSPASSMAFIDNVLGFKNTGWVNVLSGNTSWGNVSSCWRHMCYQSLLLIRGAGGIASSILTGLGRDNLIPAEFHNGLTMQQVCDYRNQSWVSALYGQIPNCFNFVDIDTGCQCAQQDGSYVPTAITPATTQTPPGVATTGNVPTAITPGTTQTPPPAR